MDLSALRNFITTYFNDSELRDLCFDLGIDYENLDGDNKAAKARELVAHCQRRNRLAELEATCRRLRSNTSKNTGRDPAVHSPQNDSQPARPVLNQSGGTTINAQTVNIYGDVTGRDKTVANNASTGGSANTPPTPPPPPADLRAAPPQSQDQFEYDVFISYSSKDKDWVRGELLHTLEARGLRVCIDFRDFRPGAPSIKEIERAVLTSRKTLLILTPDYLQSQWTEFEALLLQTLEPSNQTLRLIPLLKAKCDLPLRLKFMTYVNFVDPDDWDIAWKILLTALGVHWIPAAPAKETPEEWCLKHPYGMPPNFTGRDDEKAMLTQWLNNDPQHPLLVIRALGGFGKSALTWHWLTHDVDATQWPRVVWWSFYESDASFENFLRETLTYLKIDPRNLGPRQQVDELLKVLHQPGTLLILDGFERGLRAFSGMNAAYQGDTAAPSPATESRGRSKTPDAAKRAGAGGGVNDTDCLSPFAEHFLRSLAVLPNLRSKVLMTTRLRPRLLEVRGGQLLQGCLEKELTQMQPADAVEFFRVQGIRGSHTEIENACVPYGNHPLSLRLLAGLIIGDLQQPGDITIAKRLDVSGDLIQRQHHVLQQSYDSLTPVRQKLLSRIACFRSAVSYEALHALVDNAPSQPVIPSPEGTRNLIQRAQRFFGLRPQNDTPGGASAEDANVAKSESHDLDTDLQNLIARGLLHRDDKTNRYDLHPIVRRYAYDRLTARDRTAAHIQLRDYFAAVPTTDKVQTLDDLQPVIELYHHTVRARQYDDAFTLFRDRINKAAYYQFGAYQLQIELLLALFPDGEDRPPRLKDESAQGWTLNELANSYSLSGQPRRAVPLFEASNVPDEKRGNKQGVAIGLGNVADDQLKIGALKAAEANLRRSIDLCREIKNEFREAVGHQELGRLLAYRGVWPASEEELASSTRYCEKTNNVQGLCIDYAYRALRALLIARNKTSPSAPLLEGEGSALTAARRALELADETARTRFPYERDYVRAYWLLGAAHRLNGNLAEAEQHLSEALARCRNINAVDAEADILLDLARLRADQNDREEALRLAQEALLITERSGYVLQGADVHLFMAQLALHAGDKRAALLHAREARRLATCDGASADGPDYTYKVAYDEAGALLKELE